jgi:hypothetical protein
MKNQIIRGPTILGGVARGPNETIYIYDSI